MSQVAYNESYIRVYGAFALVGVKERLSLLGPVCRGETESTVYPPPIPNLRAFKHLKHLKWIYIPVFNPPKM